MTQVPSAGRVKDGPVVERARLLEHALADEAIGRDERAVLVGHPEPARELLRAHPDQVLASEHAQGCRIRERDRPVAPEKQDAIGDAVDHGGERRLGAREPRGAPPEHRIEQEGGQENEGPPLRRLEAGHQRSIPRDRVEQDVGEEHPRQTCHRECRDDGDGETPLGPTKLRRALLRQAVVHLTFLSLRCGCDEVTGSRRKPRAPVAGAARQSSPSHGATTW